MMALKTQCIRIKKDTATDYIPRWKSKGVYTSKPKPLYTAFVHSIKISRYRIGIKFDKDPLEQKNCLTKIVNFYIVYDLDAWPKNPANNFKFKNCLLLLSREISDKISKLKTCAQKELPKCKITISAPIKRHDHEKSSLTVTHLSKKFKDLSVSVVGNSIIGAFYLNSGDLQLNGKGLGRLGINLKLKIRKL